MRARLDVVDFHPPESHLPSTAIAARNLQAATFLGLVTADVLGLLMDIDERVALLKVT